MSFIPLVRWINSCMHAITTALLGCFSRSSSRFCFILINNHNLYQQSYGLEFNLEFTCTSEFLKKLKLNKKNCMIYFTNNVNLKTFAWRKCWKIWYCRHSRKLFSNFPHKIFIYRKFTWLSLAPSQSESSNFFYCLRLNFNISKLVYWFCIYVAG